jgi:NAD(P)-dependent dehydrogenase (short-subunit alcohol dehydrogenase family)
LTSHKRSTELDETHHKENSIPDATKARKVVLETGGSRGLGRHTALAAARAGFDVVITYRSQRKAAEAVSSEIEAFGRKAAVLSLDTSDVASFDDFASRLTHQLRIFGITKLHGLVNNADIGMDAAIETAVLLSFGVAERRLQRAAQVMAKARHSKSRAQLGPEHAGDRD